MRELLHLAQKHKMSETAVIVLGFVLPCLMTTLGAVLVFFFRKTSKIVNMITIGLAAGIMLSASIWSLLVPALGNATEIWGNLSFLPVVLGFVLGGLMMLFMDFVSNRIYKEKSGILNETKASSCHPERNEEESRALNKPSCQKEENSLTSRDSSLRVVSFRMTNGEDRCETSERGEKCEECERDEHVEKSERCEKCERSERGKKCEERERGEREEHVEKSEERERGEVSENGARKKAFKMFTAITIHNIPEGLSVGFAIGTAVALHSPVLAALMFSLGIALQNFPEGLATALPLYTSLGKKGKAFFLATLSGLVEPLFALVGFFLAAYITSLLPWLLAFAAGAMIYVIVEEMIPEIQIDDRGKWGTWAFVIGFVVMMILDVCL